jgi:Protein of unknown function DUF262
MSNKMGVLKYSEADQVAAEKQILNFQKVTNYRMKEYSMEELINLYQSGRDMDQNKWFVPKDHRPFFWDETQQAAFIESVLIGLPIPYFFVAGSKGGRFALIDGLQRLNTLEAFLENQLILNGLKKLTLLNGFRFQDLPLSRQRRFKTRVVRFIELTDKADYEVRQELFNRLNPRVR